MAPQPGCLFYGFKPTFTNLSKPLKFTKSAIVVAGKSFESGL
jgi:hypothetical protein